MKHKIPTYTRKGKIITGEGKQILSPSISAAKRLSSQLQKSNGGLGSGYLRVIS